jgi:hypothetical protein
MSFNAAVITCGESEVTPLLEKAAYESQLCWARLWPPSDYHWSRRRQSNVAVVCKQPKVIRSGAEWHGESARARGQRALTSTLATTARVFPRCISAVIDGGSILPNPVLDGCAADTTPANRDASPGPDQTGASGERRVARRSYYREHFIRESALYS